MVKLDVKAKDTSLNGEELAEAQLMASRSRLQCLSTRLRWRELPPAGRTKTTRDSTKRKMFKGPCCRLLHGAIQQQSPDVSWLLASRSSHSTGLNARLPACVGLAWCLANSLFVTYSLASY
jgi:hypothetical protein